MKEYIFELKVKESNDEFFEELENKTGIKEVEDFLKFILNENGVSFDLKLKKFEEK